MSGVHVRLDFEDEAGELWLVGMDFALQRGTRQRPRGMTHEGRQQLSDTEIVDGRAEEHGGLLCGAIALQVELGTRAAHQINLIEKLPISGAEKFLRLIPGDVLDGLV